MGNNRIRARIINKKSRSKVRKRRVVAKSLISPKKRRNKNSNSSRNQLLQISTNFQSVISESER